MLIGLSGMRDARGRLLYILQMQERRCGSVKNRKHGQNLRLWFISDHTSWDVKQCNHVGQKNTIREWKVEVFASNQ